MCCPRNISIHALLAESDLRFGCGNILVMSISIHALLAESDRRLWLRISLFDNFYPRSPCGERLGVCKSNPATADFYPRSPCGERHAPEMPTQEEIEISIHALLAESDARKSQSSGAGISISIHALLAESDDYAECYIHAPEISIHALLAESDSKSAQNSGALLRIWNKFYGDCIFMLTGKAVFYPFCPCFFHIFWCEGSGNFMIAFPSH